MRDLPKPPNKEEYNLDKKEELKSFVEHAYDFFLLWVELYGHQGVTNYIHMIGSVHFDEYMSKWGNLNKYSQQGWEALNALIKLFFLDVQIKEVRIVVVT